MNEALVEAVTARVMEKLGQRARESREEGRPRAFLVGQAPHRELGYTYVRQEPYEAVMLGSLTAGQLLHFTQEETLQALLRGMPVYLWGPGLPAEPGQNKALSAALRSGVSLLRSWGVRVLEDKPRHRLITGQEARMLLEKGAAPPAGSLLTPMARDILEGKS